MTEPSRSRASRALHILLVEDHVDTADAMAELLRVVGHRVTVAGSVGEALAAAERVQAEGAFDLVLSDLGLPDGHGADLMRELKSRYGLPGVAVSGYGTESDVRRSLASGFSAHLVKPIDVPRLLTAIRDAAG